MKLDFETPSNLTQNKKIRKNKNIKKNKNNSSVYSLTRNILILFHIFLFCFFILYISHKLCLLPSVVSQRLGLDKIDTLLHKAEHKVLEEKNTKLRKDNDELEQKNKAKSQNRSTVSKSKTDNAQGINPEISKKLEKLDKLDKIDELEKLNDNLTQQFNEKFTQLENKIDSNTNPPSNTIDSNNPNKPIINEIYKESIQKPDKLITKLNKYKIKIDKINNKLKNQSFIILISLSCIILFVIFLFGGYLFIKIKQIEFKNQIR
ncbi:hypothetical protein [Candidatus Phytoplasma fraxini]|uniref:Uncharacterized protein n=1 Tax=Ash yellows phytoplasma TaxID=35780 RepID=A0ABZ2U8R6_ASHYP